ncbi:DUF1643 domain-containing protein [Paraburkholderia pallida]|uniref:DUF1643 domain-containing protein n=1 Tax=Paraburkholderia pallida TaxID=2547399 RepID=UPI0026ADA3C5
MSAIISPCCNYRYRFERVRAAGIVAASCGINPSRADASVRDQTDLKWTCFAHRWGARKYIAGNPFAYHTPYVEDLVAVIDPIGPENDVHLARIIADADVLVPFWGDRKKLPGILRPVSTPPQRCSARLVCPCRRSALRRGRSEASLYARLRHATRRMACSLIPTSHCTEI